MSSGNEILKALPLPTLERPFGIQLWPIFDKAFSAIMGYHPQDFDFKPRETPMSTLKESSLMILLYYIIIFGGRELMRSRPALKLNGIFMVHNFYLTAISGGLLVLFLEQLIPTVFNHGIFYAICDVKGGWTPPLVILYYVRVSYLAGEFYRYLLTKLAQLPHQVPRIA
jgi:fatty acid elongase 2/fatty acid elongase 3